MTFTNDSTPMAQFMLNIMGSFAELERAMILERQREGVALAKKAGAYKGRAPAIRADNGKLAELELLHSQNTGVAEMARKGGVSAHAQGKAHEWDRAAAKAAGSKGGKAFHAKRRAAKETSP